MIKLYYDKNFYTGWCSELILLYDDLKNNINDDRFNNIVNSKFIYVNKIEDCDYVILPYKWRGLDDITKTIIDNCKLHSKKILVFYNDDDNQTIPIDEELGYVFRTSFNKSSKNKNEFALPPFFIDEFSGDFISPENINLNIGFCGFDHYYRKEALSNIKNNQNIKSDFIIRQSFWAREISEDIAIKSFNDNIKNNLFGFTSRGAGNFSYRFYQILSMGRIPVLLNTDCVLPFDDFIDYNKHSLIIDIKEINQISNIILDYFNNKTKDELFQIQNNNRKLYVDVLSPNGFLNNITKNLNEK
jgi:Fe-S cluster assembly iron-binding protein IscA